MKKFIVVVIALILTFCLVGCEDSAEPEVETKDNEDIYIWTDEETGVQYIIYSNVSGYSGMGGITPRLNADGTLYKEGGE